MIKKKKKKKLREKVGIKRFGTDSMWSRSSAQRAGTEKGRKSKGGKEIQRILGIEDDEGPGGIQDDPLSVMDIVRQIWAGTGENLPNRIYGHGKADEPCSPDVALDRDNDEEDDEEEYD